MYLATFDSQHLFFCLIYEILGELSRKCVPLKANLKKKKKEQTYTGSQGYLWLKTSSFPLHNPGHVVLAR